jgi:adenylyltransferase/sulfurtransferase
LYIEPHLIIIGRDHIFSSEEILRYSRHLILDQFGNEGQEKLKKASVLIIGAGVLGSPLAHYLTAAGVGKIGLIDCIGISKFC